MVATYVIAILIIFGINYQSIPAAFGEIFNGAFSYEGVTGDFSVY